MKILNMTRYFVMFFSMALVFQGCTEDDAAVTNFNFASFETLTKNIEVAGGETLSTDVKVFVTQVSGSDRVINVVFDPTSTMNQDYVSFPSTVTIPANSNFGVLTFETEGVDLDFINARTIKFKLVEENGLYTGKVLQVNVKQLCTANVLTVGLRLDPYGSETSWDITKDGIILASGGPYSDGPAGSLQALRNSVVCLESGDYIFTIYDSYGDGMVASSTLIGSYVLNLNGNVIVNGVGDFNNSRSHSFTVQ